MTENHVVFGTGPAGVATARALATMGKQVRVVNRSGARNGRLPADIEVVAADVTDVSQAKRAAEGAAIVYHCLNAPYHRWPELFPGLQAGVLAAAESAGARLVALENVYMYGQVDGSMTEDLPYKAHTRKGRLRAQLSQQLSEAHESGRIEVAIGRASDFYGPEVESSLGERTFVPLVAGKPAEMVGNPDMPHSYTYIDDVGRGLATLGTKAQAFGQIWHLPTAPALSTRKIVEKAFEMTGLPVKTRTMGRLMMRIGGLFVPEAREVLEMMYEFEAPFIVDSSKFQAAFGGSYTSIEKGLQETLAWYQNTHKGIGD
jgi:nucleoside-diphosphate-sugar epimerase